MNIKTKAQELRKNQLLTSAHYLVEEQIMKIKEVYSENFKVNSIRREHSQISWFIKMCKMISKKITIK